MSIKEIKEAFGYLDQHQNSMTLLQIAFMKSLKKYFTRYGRLSSSQQIILIEIKKILHTT